MRRAYTLVHRVPPHWDVGPTFETRAAAVDYNETQTAEYDIVDVTCWIDDFDAVDHGVFLVRTDCNHEVSFVVAHEPTDALETGNEAYVMTSIKAAESTTNST